MKKALILCLGLLSFSFFAFAESEKGNVLSTPNGHFALGSLEVGGGGVTSKILYLLDTKTGQVSQQGCIRWDKSEKCIQNGFRFIPVSDGSGGKIFSNAKDAAEGYAFGSLLRDAK